MGADLYLDSEYEKNRARWEPKYLTWVKKRDALRQSGRDAEADRAQEKVTKYLEKMYESGYFRDSYNSSNLLWLFELSWWRDVGELLDEETKLSPQNAGWLLSMLEQRRSTFESNLVDVERREGKERKQYFVEKYEAFRAFLQEAIERQESIVCWI